MELTVRTAHGTADVTVDVRDATTSLQQLIAEVTGQAAPDAAVVDGRLVDATLPIRMCAVLAGSIVETDLRERSPDPVGGVTLLQLTGPGAGISRIVEPGRYAVGPGRRVNAEELEAAAVEVGAFELDVRDARTVVVRPLGDQQLVLEGQRITDAVEWSTGLLQADGRMFALRHSPSVGSDAFRVEPHATPEQIDSNGRIVYNRPPGHIDDNSLLIVDAVDDAIHVRSRLWHRPGGRQPPHTIDIGITPTTRARASVDITTDRVIGITGDVDATSALARALLIEAVTNAGPSDLDVAIATTPDQLGTWDWAKWLPHVHNDGRPALLSNEHEITLFAGGRGAPGRRHCLLVVTSEQWWFAEETPLRRLVLNGPEDTTVIALALGAATTPSSCDSLIELDAVDRSLGHGRLVRLARGGARLDVLVPLPSTATALEVARNLAHLRDPDLPLAASVSATTGPATLAEFVGFVGFTRPTTGLPAPDAGTRKPSVADGARWDDARSDVDEPTPLPIGCAADEVISIDIGVDRSVIVSGSAIREALDLVGTLALSSAVAWSPDVLSIVVVDHAASITNDSIARLPHHAGTFSDRGRPAGRRFTERLRHKVGLEPSATKRVLVIVTDPVETELAAPGVIEDLLGLATSAERMHLVIATDVPIASLDESTRAACSIEVTIDSVGGRRSAAVYDRSGDVLTPFVPFEAPISVEDRLIVRPMVYGRPLSALERRLERRSLSQREVDDRRSTIERVVDDIVALAQQRALPAVESLVPSPLPDSIDAESFFAQHAGDGVPLGLIDRPDVGEPEVYWWQPGVDGSRLFVGSPRSGIHSVADVVVRGIIERFSADDVHLYAIEHNDARRSSLARVAHVGAAVAPDHPDAEALLHMLLDELERRRSTSIRPLDAPAIVFGARNVDRLSSAAIDDIGKLVADGAASGMYVLATASRPTALPTFIAGFDHVIVGGLTDEAEYAGVGVEDGSALLRHPGRCVHVPTQQLVQLASSTRSFVTSLNDITTEPATSRPPRRLDKPEAGQR